MPLVYVFDEHGVGRDNVNFEVAPREGETIQWGDPGTGDAAFRKVDRAMHEQLAGGVFGYVVRLQLP